MNWWEGPQVGIPVALLIGTIFWLWRVYRQKDRKLEALYERFIERLLREIEELEKMLIAMRSK
jgi:hypothetical protein